MSGQSDSILEQINVSNALVVVSDRSTEQTSSVFISEAGFLAQLLACRAGIGGYRRHRREEPGIASDLYRSSVARGSLPPGADRKTVRIA
ncbi:MAG: hypothetical protein ACRCUE_16760 [Bosea sp. (in: a-proteobacteria)]